MVALSASKVVQVIQPPDQWPSSQDLGFRTAQEEASSSSPDRQKMAMVEITMYTLEAVSTERGVKSISFLEAVSLQEVQALVARLKSQQVLP